MPALLSRSASSCIGASNPETLWEIRDPGVLLAIWERGAVAEIEPVLHALLQAKRPVRLDCASGAWQEFEGGLQRHLRTSGPRMQDAIRALTADVVDLAGRFSAISGREHLRIRFERVEDDGCALFHVDTLPMRMLCTYAGPGTQWVEEEDVCRDQLGSRGRSLDEANAAIVPDPDRIHTVPAWHVLIFKGRLWEGHGYSDGLVHRSAPVRHPRDFRLRLTIDFADSCTC